jgi:hypothetical protein
VFGSQTVDGLRSAIECFESAPFDPHALADLAAPFANERFDREFRAAFERGYAAWKAGREPAEAITAR